MDKQIIECDGFRFLIETERDIGAGAPWEEEDFHGPVSNWTTRDKSPGELVLNTDRRSNRFYDFAEACRIALREGWGARGEEPGMTKRQIAALAAREDYERLKAWCDDEWGYVGVVVTLLDVDGRETDFCASLWGIESDGIDTQPMDLALNVISDAGLNVEGANTVTSGAATWRVK